MTAPRPRSFLRVALAAAALAAIVGPGPAQAASCAPTTTTEGQPWPGGEWRSYGHDLSNTRHQAQETTIGTLEAVQLAPVWTFSTTEAGGDGDVTGTPVIADGCLYLGTTTGWIFAANADTGETVWASRVDTNSSLWQGGIYGSPTIAEGKVFVAVGRSGSPFVMALDQATGAPAWAQPTTIDTQGGSETYTTPVVYDDDPSDSRPPMVFVGVSGGSAELGDEADRHGFHGSLVVLDSVTGAIIRKIYTIPEDVWDQGYAGGAVWAPTPAIDPSTNYLYSVTGNPFQPQVQHPNTDAIIKVDIDRSRPTFGQIVDAYQGQVDEYFTEFADTPCVDFPGSSSYPQGLGSCFDLDMDFGTSANLYQIGGRTVVGAGQKSGVYHAAYADTMEPAWTALVGPPSAVGGIVGSAAYDGASITGPITPAGVLWSVDAAGGGYRWVSPVIDAAHYGQPVTSANGVIYTVDLKGFLDAYDAATGLPLLHRPMWLGGANADPLTLSLGGVSVARNTVYASIGTGGGSSGSVIAFRPGGGGVPGLPGLPTIPGVGAGGAVVAVPGSASSTYATPVMAVRASDPVLTFVNLDTAPHDVDHRAAPGMTPLFESDVVGLGETTGVRFNGPLEVGASYEFYCTIHPNMFGRLVAVP